MSLWKCFELLNTLAMGLLFVWGCKYNRKQTSPDTLSWKKGGWVTEYVNNSSQLVQNASTIVSKHIIVNMLELLKTLEDVKIDKRGSTYHCLCCYRLWINIDRHITVKWKLFELLNTLETILFWFIMQMQLWVNIDQHITVKKKLFWVTEYVSNNSFSFVSKHRSTYHGEKKTVFELLNEF
jgi:hypothetical protein